MSLGVKAEQRIFIKFCVELGKTPVATKKKKKKNSGAKKLGKHRAGMVYLEH